jgi:hypothetical protein
VWQATVSLEVKMMKLAGLAGLALAVGSLAAATVGVVVTILLIL